MRFQHISILSAFLLIAGLSSIPSVKAENTSLKDSVNPQACIMTPYGWRCG